MEDVTVLYRRGELERKRRRRLEDSVTVLRCRRGHIRARVVTPDIYWLAHSVLCSV